MLKKRFLILVLPLLAFVAVHKFYVSVTNINYSEKENSLQITSRVFIDDFDLLLKERYGFTANLATKVEDKEAESYIEKYTKTKFHITINNVAVPVNYIGREYDNDVVILYLEVEDVVLAKMKSIEIENGMLTDLFEEQKNLVHFKYNGAKKSFVLIKGNNKGMLKF
ncbi:hypothetical protein MWU65_14830 [Cellulophaga sp. F20128]|uniref:DUF6702 family protein n=1 Tax=Cellulophaga sp. F20128 TaxID=2926413 RepID=UPI001FF5F2B9|nr:DUF6702 family protein [Cellulophaga sp. F20128]MCK0158467.1 hypothetical protein [Cellulophaga sp. F20128]